MKTPQPILSLLKAKTKTIVSHYFRHAIENGFMCAFCLPSGFDSLMISYRLSDLALLYQLFSRVKRGQDELCSAFNEYIKVCECTCSSRI